MMKKAIAILLVLVTVVSLVACGGGSSNDPEEKLKINVQADISFYCSNNFKDIKPPVVSFTDITADGNTYTVKGKVNITDNFGDKYSGKFTGVYELNGDSFTKKSLDIETPKKQ